MFWALGERIINADFAGVRAICPVNNTQNSRARVWVRTRPTANFAHSMINLLPDGKVWLL